MGNDAVPSILHAVATNLPCWLVYLNALGPFLSFLGTLAIGVAAAVIAVNQWRIQKYKLALDLYDRRLAVYEAARTYLSNLSEDSISNANNYTIYLRATRQAPFLFLDPAITVYLTNLGNETRRLDMANRLLAVSAPAERHESAQNTRFEILAWLLEQEKVIEEKFAPYLTLHG